MTNGLSLNGSGITLVNNAEAADVTVGVTTITGGTTGYLLYNNAGVLGNIAATAFASVTGALVAGNIPILTATGIQDSGVALLTTLPARTVWGNNSASTGVPAALTLLTMGNNSASAPTYSFGASPTTGIYSSGTDEIGFAIATKRLMRMQAASGAYFIDVFANDDPTLRVQAGSGSAASPLRLAGFGAAGINLYANGGSSNILVGKFDVTSATATLNVNYPSFAANVAGQPVIMSAAGTDTNIDFTVSPKGTGVFKFGNAGSFIANGAVVTSLTGVGPTGANTTVQEWLQVKNSSGTVRYIPAF